VRARYRQYRAAAFRMFRRIPSVLPLSRSLHERNTRSRFVRPQTTLLFRRAAKPFLPSLPIQTTPPSPSPRHPATAPRPDRLAIPVDAGTPPHAFRRVPPECRSTSLPSPATLFPPDIAPATGRPSAQSPPNHFPSEPNSRHTHRPAILEALFLR